MIKIEILNSDVGEVAGAAGSLQEGCRFDPGPGTFLWEVYMFSLCLCGFTPGLPTSSRSVQNHACEVNWELQIDCRCVCECKRLFGFVSFYLTL